MKSLAPVEMWAQAASGKFRSRSKICRYSLCLAFQIKKNDLSNLSEMLNNRLD